MKNFNDIENECFSAFISLGECYHLWTPENLDIIFTCPDDFKIGMSIIGICAKLFPDVVVLTFEIMSNHLHITAAGRQERILELFEKIKSMLIHNTELCRRHIGWEKFIGSTRQLSTIEDVRNVIVYNNRNGFLVNLDHSPFSYPWGANQYYFNPGAKNFALVSSEKFTLRKRREISHSRIADSIDNLLLFEDYALPLSFCDIEKGEKLFRNASHYFNKLSRNIESNKAIAKEIGESVFYTDDELYFTLSKLAKEKYGTFQPSGIPANGKIEFAKLMRYEYNSSAKQIQRMLKVSPQILSSLGIM